MRSPLSTALITGLLASTLPAQIQQFSDLSRNPIPPETNPEFKIAVGDVNGDLWPDIVCGNMGGALPGTQNTLFLGDGFGGFIDVTATHLPQVLDWTGSVALGDIDLDGDLDLFFGNAGSQGSRLCTNDGRGVFTDVSATQFPFTGRTYYACKLVDIDQDFDLDLVARENVYLNDGRGFFTDVTSTHTPGTQVSAWGMVTGDVDNDGDVDVVFGVPNATPVLWLNGGNGVFFDGTANMPTVSNTVRGDFCIGDVDRDGDLDLFVQGYATANLLLLNQGSGIFVDASATNLPAPTMDFTYMSTMADVDLDGDLDIIEFNGANSSAQTKLFRNDGTGVFNDDTAALPAAIHGTVSGALTDLDLDGDPDLVLANWNQQNVVWMNLHRHTYAAAPPTIGNSYSVDFHSQPGYATAPTMVLPFIGLAQMSPPTSLPPFGYVTMNMATIVTWPVGPTTLPAGLRTVTLTVPPNPAMVGGDIFWQALMVEGTNVKLTNTIRDTVQ